MQVPDLEPLIKVREEETFLGDERDVKAALVHARRFAQEPGPFKDRGEAGGASNAIKALKNVKADADKNRLDTTAPFRLTTKAVNDEYSELMNPVNAAIQALESRAIATRKQEDREAAEARKAEQDRLDREAEEAAAKAAETARAAEDSPEDADAQRAAGEAHRAAAEAAVATPKPQTAPKQLRGDFSSFGTVTDYEFEVTDKDSLPAEHTMANEKSIKAAIKGEKAMAKAQEREFNLKLIPGVRIWPKDRGVSR